MAGIAGIAARGQQALVGQMLDRQCHRGPAGNVIVERDGATLGLAWTEAQTGSVARLRHKHTAADETSNSRFARAEMRDGQLVLVRDALGVAPLYYGTTGDGRFCFASEVKALLGVTTTVCEFPPGHRYSGGRFEQHSDLEVQQPLAESPLRIAEELRRRLGLSVERRLDGASVGSWLSGGLDSSAIAALARPHVARLHTFAVGLSGAPDLEFARAVGEHLGTDHHEILVTLEDLLAVLSDVIFHLESFDGLLVRSSLVNYLAAGHAADYVPMVLSGEAGDELFAGYEYLQDLPPAKLPAELIDITKRLHNTALQRVDRSASAHGTVALVPFTDPDVVDYALRIPVEYKIRDGVEKWILRRAMEGTLPEHVLNRRKSKFWEGAGVEDLLASHAEDRISDNDFKRERTLANGWTLHSKEELMYRRIFSEHFGPLKDLSWMGRTKGSPIAA
jgi:asparagine synthase (glutamine-hydrolysing)